MCHLWEKTKKNVDFLPQAHILNLCTEKGISHNCSLLKASTNILIQVESLPDTGRTGSDRGDQKY